MSPITYYPIAGIGKCTCPHPSCPCPRPCPNNGVHWIALYNLFGAFVTQILVCPRCYAFCMRISSTRKRAQHRDDLIITDEDIQS